MHKNALSSLLSVYGCPWVTRAGCVAWTAVAVMLALHARPPSEEGGGGGGGGGGAATPACMRATQHTHTRAHTHSGRGGRGRTRGHPHTAHAVRDDPLPTAHAGSTRGRPSGVAYRPSRSVGCGLRPRRGPRWPRPKSRAAQARSTR